VDLNDLEMKCFLAKISRNNIEDQGLPPRFVPETPIDKKESANLLPSLGQNSITQEQGSLQFPSLSSIQERRFASQRASQSFITLFEPQ